MKHTAAFLTLSALSFFTSCSSCPFGCETTPKGKVEHVVLVWLKKPGDAAERSKVVSTAKMFQAEIQEIQHLSVGMPLASDRAVVDDSFDVGLVMRFANPTDLGTYEKHPVHVKAVKEVLQPIAAKLLVYDVVTQ